MRRSQRKAHAAIWTALAVALPLAVVVILVLAPAPVGERAPVRLDAADGVRTGAGGAP